MEAPMKSSFGENGREKEEVIMANKRTAVRGWELVLRFLALVLTLVAAVVLGVGKQTKVIPLQLVSTLPPLYLPVHAKWHYLSAFVYFVVANAIACTYAAISLLLTLANGGGKNCLALIVILIDLLMVGLLFSCNGEATAVGLIGYNRNSHVRWDKVCNVFGKFCHQVAAAIIISVLGSLVFLLLVVMATVNLHKKHK